VFDAVPSGVRWYVESAVLFGVGVLVLLVTFGVIWEDWLSGIAAVVVVACLVRQQLREHQLRELTI
jgi:hypothetical protein